MLTPALIQNIRAFLDRVELRGAEVPAFMEILTALAAEDAELRRPPPPPPPSG